MTLTNETRPVTNAGQEQISEAFVSARLQARALHEFPGVLPETTADAYKVQLSSIAKWPDEVVGWKVGGIAPHFQEIYGEERLVGPIFAKSVRDIRSDPDQTVEMPVVPGGFAAVEAEYLIKVARDVAPESCGTDLEALLSLVEAMHIGVEIASSPFPDINNLGPCSIISDFGNNAGLIVGPEIEDWSHRPSVSFSARVTIDGEEIGNTPGADRIEDGPVAALAFVLKQFGRRGLALPKGTWISTGAVSGVHEIAIGSKSTAEFGDFGSIDMLITGAEPAADQK